METNYKLYLVQFIGKDRVGPVLMGAFVWAENDFKAREVFEAENPEWKGTRLTLRILFYAAQATFSTKAKPNLEWTS